tara:strand:- start:853 stop:1101 length:249 start_codon:yes stop_codon:yes gene_type:complete
MSKIHTFKQGYTESKSCRLHTEELLKALEKTRELLEVSIKEMDERIMDLVNERKDFERLEEEFLQQMIAETVNAETPKPWHG